MHNLNEITLVGLDIGCSGQKPMEWQRLGHRLNYFGVDPLKNEIEVLRQKYPNDTFLNVFIKDVGCTGSADEVTSKFFSRTSAYHDMQAGFDLVQKNFNSGMEVVYSDEHLSAKETLAALQLEKVDILKIDVDGDDFALLKAFLSSSQEFAHDLLAFEIESQFHGNAGEYGNHFSNILNLANMHGFYLYSLDSYTYSRNDLRKSYVYDFPAQTDGGQVLWADALFMRDGMEVTSSEQRRKLALILDIYDLDDCAFEIIVETPEDFGLNNANLNDFKKKLESKESLLIIILQKFLKIIKQFAIPKV